MKNWRKTNPETPAFPSFCRMPLLAGMALLLAAGVSLGQTYSVDWFTIDGGGGTCTGGVFSAAGTIGQCDANATAPAGGGYSLTGAFWALVVIQAPDAPTLSIHPAGPGQALISWAPDTPGFVLQEASNLSVGNWLNSPSGSANPVTVLVPANMKFYRLSKP